MADLEVFFGGSHCESELQNIISCIHQLNDYVLKVSLTLVQSLMRYFTYKCTKEAKALSSLSSELDDNDQSP